MRLLQLLAACALAALAFAAPAQAQTEQPPADPVINALDYAPVNGNMECATRAAQAGFNGTVPGGWRGVRINLATDPNVESALFAFGGMNCNNDSTFIEKVEGRDSWTFKAPDLEETSQPGKPFDVALYRQVPVQAGVAYSLSAWMVSLCGGSANPNDCPQGYYISKMLGIDPTGGTNPSAASVQWVEDRSPHVDAYGNRVGWRNLRLAATAQGTTMTVFVRINSPFQHHGNHAFVDAVRLVRAPVATLGSLPATHSTRQLNVSWGGSLGPDVPQLPVGQYTLYFDVQYRLGATGAWRDWLTHQPAGSAAFNAPDAGSDLRYYFRVTPLAQQPDNQHGLWPYMPGVPVVSPQVQISLSPPGPPRVFVPMLRR